MDAHRTIRSILLASVSICAPVAAYAQASGDTPETVVVTGSLIARPGFEAPTPVTTVSAESTLTRDTVPVSVDAIIFWLVWNAEKAILEVENYLDAISLSAQTALLDALRCTNHSIQVTSLALPHAPNNLRATTIAPTLSCSL